MAAAATRTGARRIERVEECIVAVVCWGVVIEEYEKGNGRLEFVAWMDMMKRNARILIPCNSSPPADSKLYLILTIPQAHMFSDCLADVVAVLFHPRT